MIRELYFHHTIGSFTETSARLSLDLRDYYLIWELSCLDPATGFWSSFSFVCISKCCIPYRHTRTKKNKKTSI